MGWIANAADTLPPVPRPPEAVECRLPGRARPGRAALQEYEEWRAALRQRLMKRDLLALMPLYAPEPDRVYRWRIRLDCGCITEALTFGNKHPAGQRRCEHDDDPLAPYRAISTWDERREVVLEADPVDPPSYWEDLDEALWEKMRHPEPRTCAFWRVTLACGHRTDAVAPGLSWQPADGPRLVPPKRLKEMIEEFEDHQSEPRTEAHGKVLDEHTARMLNQGWPSPQPETSCFECRSARFITAFQRVGCLRPAAKTASPTVTDSDGLQRKLQAAEAKVAKLRAQLGQFDQG